MAKPKRLPRAVREQQMLDAAVAVFARNGYHAAAMDDIADRAGISKPMVYAYLGAKEDVFLACVRREMTKLVEAIVGAIDFHLPPDEQLWRGLRAFFAFVGEHRDGWNVLYRQARVQEPFAGELTAMRGRMVEVVSGLLDEVIGVAGGTRRPSPDDLAAMAHALVGAGESLADWVVDQATEPPDVSAARLMNFIWLGAERLLNGQTWRPAAPLGGSTTPPGGATTSPGGPSPGLAVSPDGSSGPAGSSASAGGPSAASPGGADVTR